MQRRFKAPVVLAVLLGLSACSASYNREDTIQDFVDEGLDEATATCLVDGLEDKLGEDRLNDRGNLTPEDEAILTEVTTECVLGG